MILNAVKKVFGSRNDRLVKKHRKTVNQINALEAEIETLTDEQIAETCRELKDEPWEA